MTQVFVDFRHVKANATFESVLAHYGLKQTGKGRQISILCPFHDDKNPSCKINLDKKAFHCFACGAKGNVLDFVAQKERTDLRSAALLISAWCGIDPAPPKDAQGRPSPNAATGEKQPVAQRTKSKRRAASLNRETPLSEPPAASQPQAPVQRLRPLSFSLQLDPAHPYLRERGLADVDVQMFGLGFCSRGVMKNRIAIPIHDAEGNLVAYAGRWPGEPPEGEPKYRLPEGFEKSLVLYNLNRVPKETHEIVVVEGFFGAIALHKLGLSAAACMGNSMSEEQCALLVARGIRIVKVLFDGDLAGEEAGRKLAGELASKFFVRRVVLPNGRQPDTATAEVVAGERPAWLEELFTLRP